MISTHVLDTSIGQPAAGVNVTLEKKSGDKWSEVASDKTNADGRIAFHCPAEEGVYRMHFAVGEYFKKKKLDAFFPEVPVQFQISDTRRKYHVPLLLNPFGYSTYRGS